MLKVKDLLEALTVQQFEGNREAQIKEPIQVDTDNKREEVLMWVGPKYAHLLNELTAGTIICSSLQDVKLKAECNYLVVENPRSAFQQVLEQFFVPVRQPEIATSAFIHPSVKFAEKVSIGHNAVIEEGCEIGEGAVIGHNTVLFANTKVGKAVTIGANCSIGGVGFGYEKDKNGKYKFIPHLGNVVIEDHVDIGNNTTIDRAVLGSTLLKQNSKVDNLVHIAHGVEVGRNSLIIANAMVAGSVKIGENVWVAPSSSIINGKSVEDNALIGLGAVVVKNVAEGEIIVGNPGKPLPKKNKS